MDKPELSANDLTAAVVAGVFGDVLSVPKSLVVAVGGLSSALALATLFRWSGETDSAVNKVDRSGEIWLVPTEPQWFEQACLSGTDLTKALSHLKTNGLIDVRSFVWRPQEAGDDEKHAEGTAPPSNGSDSGARQHIRVIWDACFDLLSGDVDLKKAASSPKKQTSRKRSGPVTLASLGFVVHDDDRERYESSLRLAVTLAKLVGANTQKEPVVTKTWVSELERMARLDGYNASQIENAILWSQSNDFWWKNIQSPQKLRRHFELLREQARRNPQQAKQLIEKSKLILEGKQKALGDKKDVFDETVDSASFDENSEEELAKSWGMIWSEEQQRWVQPRPEL